MLIFLRTSEEPECELQPQADREILTAVQGTDHAGVDGIETRTTGNIMINTGEALLEISQTVHTRVKGTREIALHHETPGMGTEANTLHTAEMAETDTEALLDTMEMGEEILHFPLTTRVAGEGEEEVLTPLTEEVLTQPLDKRILSQRPRATEMQKIAVMRTQL